LEGRLSLPVILWNAFRPLIFQFRPAKGNNPPPYNDETANVTLMKSVPTDLRVFIGVIGVTSDTAWIFGTRDVMAL
jgi:hypothetical protein